MDLWRTKSLGSCRRVEDEEDEQDDDDADVTHGVLTPGTRDAAAERSRFSAAAKEGESGLQGSESSSLASFLGVKKERAENGELYVFLEVKEGQYEDDDHGSPVGCEDEKVFQGSDHAGETVEEIRFDCEDLNQDVVAQEEQLEESPEQQNTRKSKPVDLTPFLSFLSECIRESKDSDTGCTAAIISDDHSDDGAGAGGDQIETSGDIQLESFSCARIDSDSSDETTNVRGPGVYDEKRSGASGTPAGQLNPAASFAPGTSCGIVDEELRAALAENLSDGDVHGIEPYPVAAESYVASEAAEDEQNGVEEDCSDRFEGNGLHGFEADGFQSDLRFHETPEKKQVQCFGTDQKLQQNGERSANLEQIQWRLAPAVTLTTSEDSESFRERTSSDPETRRHETALAMVSDTDLGRLSEDLKGPIDETPSATATDHTLVMSSNQTSNAAAAAVPGRRNVFKAHSMFDSWDGMDINKVLRLPGLGGGGGVQSFQSKSVDTCLDLWFKPLPRHCDSSSCISESHTVPGPRISNGSEIPYNPLSLQRSDMSKDHVKATDMVHRPDSSPCSCNYDFAAAAEVPDARSEKFEGGFFNPGDMGMGVSTTTTTTTKLHHHLKTTPAPLKKCKSPRKAAPTSAFKYVESWKRLKPPNGEDPDKDRQKVIQALYTFEELRQNLREAEELRAAKARAKGLTCLKRPDLKAGTEMRLRGLYLNTNYIGNVPGIYVGDHFWYRIEMVLIGLHKQLEAGIAFLSKLKARSSVSVATSIVMKHSSNPYRDDVDNGEFITYTGQGGLSARSSTAHCVSDQVLTRGNEAMKNSYEGHWPIRVIRGDKDKKSPTGEVYTYIGLYEILGMRYEPGKDGNLVYMFDLKRQGGQQPLPICATLEPHLPISTEIRPRSTYVANKLAVSSESIAVKRKWEDLPNACDHVSSTCSSRGQWGIPVNFPHTNQALYVRGSW